MVDDPVVVLHASSGLQMIVDPGVVPLANSGLQIWNCSSSKLTSETIFGSEALQDIQTYLVWGRCSL